MKEKYKYLREPEDMKEWGNYELERQPLRSVQAISAERTEQLKTVIKICCFFTPNTKFVLLADFCAVSLYVELKNC